MDERGKPLSAVRDGILLKAHDYWDSKRQGRRMPSRADLDPREMPRLLPNVILVDVVAPDNRLKIRLAGTLVVDVYGMDYTGHYLDELFFGEQRSKVLADYGTVVGNRQPHVDDHRFVNVRNTAYDIERIILPLSDNDSGVNMLFAVLSFREVASTVG